MPKIKSNIFEDGEIFDNVPHVRKTIETGLESFVERGYANDASAGGLDLTSTYQKTRTGVEAGVDYVDTGISYIFITKPNLNLTKNLAAENYSVKQRNSQISQDSDSAIYNTIQNGFFEYVARNYPTVIDSLTCNNSSKQNFIPLLFNHYRSISIEDHSVSENTYSETFRGYSQKLPTTAGPSFGGGTLSINYDEISPPLITYLHKIWFEYIEGVKFNTMTPSLATIKRRELDYTSSLYYFLLGPDGETITFWGKYTGLFPQNVPYSSFSSEVGSREIVKISISYVYNFKEFLDPSILVDFNDVFMNDNDIFNHKVRDGIAEMDNFQGKLIKMTDSGNYNSNSIYNTGLLTMEQSKSSHIYQSSDGLLEQRSFRNVGVYKKDKQYKLLFYN